MLDKIYLEITNVCNLNCTFCHKTSRKKKFMSENEFELSTDKLRHQTKYLYFHLMGEPTLHPLLPTFIAIAKEKGFIPMLTTNGSLLSDKGSSLLACLPYKISISLHAPEANPTFADPLYLDNCINFAKNAAEKGCIIALRLWNLGTDTDNSSIIKRLHDEFSGEWKPIRGGSSLKLSDNLYLEWGQHFEWPDPNLLEADPDSDSFCYGLRDHCAVLVDGTVIPCCLDADGNLSLGNLFESNLEEILSTPRAKAIYDGFTKRRAVESFCRKCGFAKRFSKI
ncbi:MAG: SPASM domain-containing protein [Clostridia bacterium]|nr:SPASM domain-containing protein [Clostridia bacterium]